MNRLVSSVMVLTLVATCGEIYEGKARWWVGWGTLAILAVGVTLALTRTVPNAVRLGSAAATPVVQTEVGRAIYSDPALHLGRTLLLLLLQLCAASRLLAR